jgi:hypothetical protein
MIDLPLCAPSIIYIAFSLTQIIIDFFKGHSNVGFMKIIVTIIFTFMLEFLCRQGLSFISWIIVFIPFIFMSIIVGLLLLLFGYDPETGNLHVKCNDCEDKYEGNLIFSNDPNYNNSDDDNKEDEGPTITYSTNYGDEYKGYSMYPYGSSDVEFS